MGFTRNIRSLVLILGLTIGLGSLAAFAAPPPSLEELEKVTAKAENLDTFLARPDLQEEYFQRLSDYFGEEKFDRKAYDAILVQLRDLRQKVPAIADRLWESTNLGESFSVNLPVQSSGLQLKTEEWKRHLASTQDTLRTRMGDWLDLSEAEQEKRLQEITGKLSNRIADFEETQRGLKRVERISRAKKFYAGFAADIEDLQKAGAALQYQALFQEQYLDPFHSNDADLVIQAWRNFREGVGLKAGGKEIPGAVRRALLGELLPDLVKPNLEMVTQPGSALPLAAESDLFRVKTKKTRKGIVPEGATSSGKIDFKVIPRRLHGIWKGVSLGECVGGNCASLQALTPERWATIALDESRLYHVEQGGSYLGFVQLVPVKKDGRTYASIEFGAPILAKRVIQEKSGAFTAESLSRVLVAELRKRLPAKWSGLLLGKSGAINNAGVQSSVRNSPAYVAGKRLSTGGAEHPDPLAQEIIRASPKESYAATYGGNMIVDATVKDQDELRVLQPDLERKSFGRQSTGKYLTKILQSENPDAAYRVLTMLTELGYKAVSPTLRAEELGDLIAAIDQAGKREADAARYLLLRTKKLDAPAQKRVWELLTEELRKPGALDLPGTRVLADLFEKCTEPVPKEYLEQLGRLALQHKGLNLPTLLDKKGAFAGPLSPELKSGLIDFYLHPIFEATNSFDPVTLLKRGIATDLAAQRELRERILAPGRQPKPREISLALSLSEAAKETDPAEFERFLLRLVESVPVKDFVATHGPSPGPILAAIEANLEKIPRERLAELILFPVEFFWGKNSYPRSDFFARHTVPIVKRYLEKDPVWLYRHMIDLYGHTKDPNYVPNPSVTDGRARQLEKFFHKEMRSIVWHTPPEDIEGLVRVALQQRNEPNKKSMFAINPILVEMREQKKPGFSDPATFDALLDAQLDKHEAAFGHLSPEEEKLFQEAKVRKLATADAQELKRYFQRYPDEISERWAQKILFRPTADPEAFAWAHFEGFGKNLKQLTPEAWDVLRHRLLDPDSKVHARTAYFLLESELEWPAGLLSAYLDRIVTEVPAFENRFALAWTFQKLIKRGKVDDPTWKKFQKYGIDSLVHATYSEYQRSISTERKIRIIREALESGDPQLIGAVQATFRDETQQGKHPPYWEGLLDKDGKVLVKPVSPWSCSGIYGKISRALRR